MSAIAIRSILKDLGFEQSAPTYLLTDSKGAYAAARNPINSKVRHVNMRYHRVRQAIRNGHVRSQYVPSAAFAQSPWPRRSSSSSALWRRGMARSLHYLMTFVPCSVVIRHVPCRWMLRLGPHRTSPHTPSRLTRMLLRETGFLPKLCAMRTSEDRRQYGFRGGVGIHSFPALSSFYSNPYYDHLHA